MYICLGIVRDQIFSETGTGTGNGTPEGAGTTAEGAGKPGDTSHSTHSRLLRPGGPASVATAVVNGVSEPTVAGGGSSGDPEAEGDASSVAGDEATAEASHHFLSGYVVGSSSFALREKHLHFISY